MDLELDDFAAVVNSRAAQWRSSGVQWQLHRGRTYDKSAAWIDCSTGDREATLIVCTTGEAEVDIGEISTGVVTSTHYEMSALDDLDTCLDNLIHQLISPHSRT